MFAQSIHIDVGPAAVVCSLSPFPLPSSCHDPVGFAPSILSLCYCCLPRVVDCVGADRLVLAWTEGSWKPRDVSACQEPRERLATRGEVQVDIPCLEDSFRQLKEWASVTWCLWVSALSKPIRFRFTLRRVCANDAHALLPILQLCQRTTLSPGQTMRPYHPLQSRRAEGAWLWHVAHSSAQYSWLRSPSCWWSRERGGETAECQLRRKQIVCNVLT